jgi:hypothetical protein
MQQFYHLLIYKKTPLLIVSVKYLVIYIYIYIQGGARNVITLIAHETRILLSQKHLTFGKELILIGCKIVPNEEHVQCEHPVPKC